MRNQGLVKNFVAGATIAKHRIVKFGANDDTVVQSAAAADLHIGVSDLLGGAEGRRCDIVLSDIAEVEYGGTVTRGQPLTADNQGRAVTATAGATVIGAAMKSGVVGDIGSVHLSRSQIPAGG